MKKSKTSERKAHTIPEPVKRGDGSYVTKVQDGWVPLPAELVASLGWNEGTELEAEVLEGDEVVKQILIRRKDVLKSR